MTPTQPINEATGNDIRQYRDDAEEVVQTARRQLSDVMDDITDRAREYGRMADEQVQQNPWAAVGVGFGVGVVMGALLMMAARR